MNREITTTETPTPVRHFTVQLSAPRRGARLARLLATEQLPSWELPFGVVAHLVEVRADRWGVVPGPPPCKTVPGGAVAPIPHDKARRALLEAAGRAEWTAASTSWVPRVSHPGGGSAS
ncbi:hypothetical protein [Streptomyces sp. 7N604]|uniref:hypothetical protein n=1 Tax=Streptomyces sp. 7N604 TaxID=3457415 RepID=UPI003FCFB895